MTKQELIKLKKMLFQEKTRREQINILLNNEYVIKFMELQNVHYKNLNERDTWDILKNILLKFKISETNGILICTDNLYTDCTIMYQDTDYREESIEFGSEISEYRTYKDIENGKSYTAYLDKYIEEEIKRESDSYYILWHESSKEYCEKHHKKLVSDIESRFIVLNPNNSTENLNGYEEVRKYFFMSAIEKGQSKAKQLILSKYPLMK